MFIKNLNNLLKNNKGTALFLSLMILSGVLIVSLGAASLIVSGIKQGKTQADSTKAYYAAEAGAERILWEIRKNNFAFLRSDASPCLPNDYVKFNFPLPSECSNIQNPVILLNSSSYDVKFISGGISTTTESIGSYGDAKRSVEINY